MIRKNRSANNGWGNSCLSVLVAISAPTALAVRVAEAAGITLIAVARSVGFEIVTHGGRIKADRSVHILA